MKRSLAVLCTLLLVACADQPTAPDTAPAVEPGAPALLVLGTNGGGIENFDLADGSGCAAVNFGWNWTPEGLGYSFDPRGAFQTALARSAPCAYAGYATRLYPQDEDVPFTALAVHAPIGWDPARLFPAYYIIYDRSMSYRIESFTIPGDGWTVLDLPSGPGVYILDVAGGGAMLMDDLVWGDPVFDPTDKDACKDGGWAAFGFRNQGQCVRFVETGKDSR